MDMIETLRKLAACAAFLVIAFVVYATLSPIQMRPHVAGVGMEHFGAFAVIGFLLAVAFPRQTAIVAILVLAGAVVLELAQFLAPGRHGRVPDAAMKAIGALAGIAMGWFANLSLPYLRS